MAPIRLFSAFALVAAALSCGGTSEKTESSEADINDTLTLGDPAGPRSLPDDYERGTAEKKQHSLLAWVSATEYCAPSDDGSDSDEPLDYATDECTAKLPMGHGTMDLVYEFAKAIPWTLRQAFKPNEGDELTEGRVKIFHPFGSVATFEMTISEGDYSGILAAGQTVFGVARLSLGGPGTFKPGIGLKFLVDGVPSVNTHVMHSLDGQGDNQNFFAFPFSHRLPTPESYALQAIGELFKVVKSEPFELPIEHLASVNPDGSTVEPGNVAVPYELIFTPTEDAAQLIQEDSTLDFRAELRRIEPGTVLLDVMARAERGDEPVKIGELKTTSYIVASDRGDRQLFFRHVGDN